MAVKIAIVGAGAWGTALADCLSNNGHDVLLWCYKDAISDSINTRHRHHRLPDIQLSSAIRATTDLNLCYDVDYFILGLSSAQLLDYEQVIDWSRIQCPVGILAKGIIEPDWFISKWLDARLDQLVFIMSGPNLAIEVANRSPAATVIASNDESLNDQLQKLFSNHYFRCYTSTDIIGVQCGGIFKNVFAIAAGCIDGMALGDNTKSAFITRGLVELKKISIFFGANEDTVFGLSGLGDLIATCTSPKSRNWQLGYSIGSLEDSSKWFSVDRGQTEGYRTIQLIYKTIVEQSLDLPIMIAIARLISGELTPQQVIKTLMERGLKSETNR